jgi:hypothetical protein
MLFFTPMVNNVFAFKVNTIDNASVINTGPVQIVDMFVSYKRNQAVSEINGDLSPVNMPFSSIVDPDVVDSASAKGSAV